MTITEQPGTQSVGTAGSSPAPQRTSRRDIGLMLTAATSTQAGAAWGSHAFGAIGPAGVVAVRQLIGVLVLLPVTRPDVRSHPDLALRPRAPLPAAAHHGPYRMRIGSRRSAFLV